MKKSGGATAFWRKVNLRYRKSSDMDGVASRADELLSSLETAEADMRDLIKSNAELTKTFAEQLKNLAADFERRSLDEHTVAEQKFEGLKEAVDKKLYAIQREVGEHADKMIDAASRQGDLLKQEQAIVSEKLDRACGAVANVDGSISGIRTHLAEQNQIQRRYQEGYDFQILRNFVRQIIQMIAALSRRIEYTEEGEAKEDLVSIRKGLIDLLNKNGVEQIVPVIGSDYDDEMRQIAKATETVYAPTPSFVGTVAEVIQPGYMYTFTDDKNRARCLQPAKITVFQAGLVEEEEMEEQQQAFPETGEEEDQTSLENGEESALEINEEEADSPEPEEEIVEDSLEEAEERFRAAAERLEQESREAFEQFNAESQVDSELFEEKNESFS